MGDGASRQRAPPRSVLRPWLHAPAAPRVADARLAAAAEEEFPALLQLDGLSQTQICARLRASVSDVCRAGDGPMSERMAEVLYALSCRCGGKVGGDVLRAEHPGDTHPSVGLSARHCRACP